MTSAIDALYRSHGSRVLAYATKLVGKGAAEDVAARVWETLLTAREADPKLLAVITRRCAYKHHHREGRERAKLTLIRAGEGVKGASPQMKRRCKVCKRLTSRKDLCEAHYYRLRRTGSLGPVEVAPTFKAKAKLTDAQVSALRADLNAGMSEVAASRKYGIGTAQVSRIRNGLRRGRGMTPTKRGKGFRTDLARGRHTSLVRGA